MIQKRNADKIGERVRVIYDDIDYDKQLFVGRTSTQAPDIDNVVYFTSDERVQVGNFYDVQIEGTDGIDLVGRCME